MDIYANAKAILTDIEGTISSPSFMKGTLLPYIAAHLPDYVWDQEPDLLEYLDAVREAERNPSLNTEELIEVLRRYIKEGQRRDALTSLQTIILKDGYESGKIQAGVYEDVLRAFKRWRGSGKFLYVYSRFSLSEQRLFFAHTKAGDINATFSKLFDTGIGEKKEAESYEKIAMSIGLTPAEVLFLTDNVEDAISASNAGMNVIILDRQACLENSYGRRIEHDFDNILPESVPA